MEGRPRLKRGRGEGKGKGGEGREEGDVGGPRDILSRGPPVPSYATGSLKSLETEPLDRSYTTYY